MSRKKDRLPGKIITAFFFVLVFCIHNTADLYKTDSSEIPGNHMRSIDSACFDRISACTKNQT